MRLRSRFHPVVPELAKLALVLGLLCALGWGSRLSGQAKVKINVRAAAPFVQFDAPGPVPVEEEEKPGDAFGGALLDTDPDVDNLLIRASEYVRDGKYREASMVLQHVIDKAANVMTSSNGRIYIPARQSAESILLGMGPEGLSIYRLVADGPARTLLPDAEAWLKEANLREVVRRYGASSLGPEAAYRLGCLLLDRHDYRAARQVFRRLLEILPQAKLNVAGPAVPGTPGSAEAVEEQEVLVRLALASARVGDRETARTSLAQWRRTNRVDTPLVKAIDRLIQSAGQTAPKPSNRDWPMSLGTSRRDGLMPASMLDNQQDKSVSLLWDQKHEGKIRLHPKIEAQMRNYSGQQRPQSRAQLINRWEQNRWNPSSQLFFQGDRVLVKTDDTLHCYHLDSGQLLWRSEPAIPNIPANMQIYFAGGYYPYPGQQTTAYPTTPQEQSRFLERLGTSAAVIQGVVYTIEGSSSTSIPGMRFRGFINNRNISLGSRNVLAAYELNTGKLLWRTATQAPNEDETNIVNFRSVPLLCAEYLVAAVEISKSLYLAVIQPSDGAILQKIFLCGEVSDGENDYSPLSLALDGSDLYVSTGRGWVLALDGTDGSVRWAARYNRYDPRAADPNRRFRGYGNQAPWPQGKTWNEDTLLLSGDLLLATPSDASQLLIMDRRTGQTVLSLEREDASYCLGLADGTLFVAGPSVLKGYEIPSGKLRWSSALDNVTGRGALTADRIYLPMRDLIAVYDIASGKRVGELQVAGRSSDPLGNLYSAGEHLLVSGMDTVYALTNLRMHLVELDKRIAAGDSSARLTRARLKQDSGQFDQALEDMRYLITAANADEGLQQSARKMLVDLALSRAAADLPQAVTWLEVAESVAQSASDRARVALRRANWHSTRGAPLLAAQQYVQVVRDGQEIFVPPGDDPSLQIQAAYLASLQLDRLAVKANDSLRAWFQKTAEDSLKGQPADSPAEAWLKIARMAPRSRAAFDALQLAAKIHLEQGQPELAELLHQSMAQSDNRTTAVAGMTALARFYRQMGWSNSAAATWRRLLELYANESVQWEGQSVLAGTLAKQQLQALSQPLVKPPAAQPAEDAVPDYQLLFHDKAAQAGFVLNWGDAQESELARDHLLMLVGGRSQLMCRSLVNGRTIWAVSVPRGSKFNQTNFNSPLAFWQGSLFPGRQLLRTGHLGFLVNSDQVRAFSLVNGRLLWSTSFGSALDMQNYNRMGLMSTQSDQLATFAPVAIDRDLVAMVRTDPAQGREELVLLEAASGQVLWKRAQDRMDLDAVAFSGDCVAAMYDGGKTCELYERDSGALVYQLKLEDRLGNTPVYLTPQGLLVQESQGVTLRSWTSGKTLWSTASKGSSYRVFGISQDHLGVISYPSQQLSIVQIASGKLLAQFSTSGMNIQSLAATPDGKQIVITGHKPPNRMALTVLDIASGRIGTPLDMGMYRGYAYSEETLTAPYLPKLINVNDKGEPMPQNSYSNYFQVGLIRRSDGKQLPNLKLPMPADRQRINNLQQPPVIIGSALVLASQDGLMVYVDRAKPAPGSASPAPDKPAPATP